MAEAETRASRADAPHNREQLLAVATRVFMSADIEPSMRTIAREAGGKPTRSAGRASVRAPEAVPQLIRT